MGGVAVGEHVGLRTGLGGGVFSAIRHDLLQRLQRLVPPAQLAVHQDFERAGVAVPPSVLEQSRQHPGHPAHHGVITVVRRVVQREAEVPLHAVHRLQQRREAVRFHHVPQHGPRLGIEIDFAAAAVLGTDIFRRRKSPGVPSAVPCTAVDGGFHFVKRFLQKGSVIAVPQPKHHLPQFPQSEAELLREHDGFRFFLWRNVQRIIPVGEINAHQPVPPPVLQEPVHGSFHMLQHRGLPAVLPFDGQREDGSVPRLLDQLAHRPDDPEGLV